MRGDDPDAMWRPGYTGSFGYPSMSRPRRRRSRVIVLAVLGLVGAAAGVVVLARPGGDRVDAAGQRIGVAAQLRWAASLDGFAVTSAAGSADGVIVLVDPVGTELIALDAATGERRWGLDLPGGRIDSVDVIDDVVVVSQTAKGDNAAVAGVPVRTGDIAWTHSIDRYDTVADEGDGRVAVVGAGRIELLDVHDGTTMAAVDGEVSWSRSATQRRLGGRLEVLDRRTLRPAAVVDLEGLGAGVGADVEVRAVRTPDGIVVATPDAVLLLDGDGAEVRDALVVRQPGANSVGLELLDDTGRYVAAQHGDRLVVMTTSGGELRELWSDTAWLVDWRIDPTHRLVAAARVIGSIITMPPVVLDAESGQPLWDAPAAVQQSSPLQVFANDGFVRVMAAGGIARAPLVIGYDLDRREMWRREVGPGSRVHVVDRGFVSVDDAAEGGVTVTLYA